MPHAVSFAASIGALLWTLALAAVPPAAAQIAADPRIDVRGLPLFDAHIHYSQTAWNEIPVARALALLDAGGVAMAAVSSTPDDGTLQLYRADPERFVPVLRPYRTSADLSEWPQQAAIPGYLEERLKLGVHKGIGEFHLAASQAGSAVVEQTVRLAVARNLVLHAHADEDAVKRLFAIDAKARVLWAHAGFSGADRVRAMVERYPNLWVEFAIRGDLAAGGELKAEWRDLVLAHPDRFLVGTDTYIVSRWQSLPEIVGEVRAWLLKLPLAVAEKLAYRNALGLFGIDEERFRSRLRR